MDSTQVKHMPLLLKTMRTSPSPCCKRRRTGWKRWWNSTASKTLSCRPISSKVQRMSGSSAMQQMLLPALSSEFIYSPGCNIETEYTSWRICPRRSPEASFVKGWQRTGVHTLWKCLQQKARSKARKGDGIQWGLGAEEAWSEGSVECPVKAGTSNPTLYSVSAAKQPWQSQERKSGAAYYRVVWQKLLGCQDSNVEVVDNACKVVQLYICSVLCTFAYWYRCFALSHLLMPDICYIC